MQCEPADARGNSLATRDVNARSSDGLFAFGVRINGLQRATIDLTRPAEESNAAHVYVERAPADPTDVSARFVVDIDAGDPARPARTRRAETT